MAAPSPVGMERDNINSLLVGVSTNIASTVRPAAHGSSSLIALFRAWRRRRAEIGYLANSDHRLQLDLLATGQSIESEMAKPFWRS
jgi:uncharacterized protein YjiS (DUF1127 family)